MSGIAMQTQRDNIAIRLDRGLLKQMAQPAPVRLLVQVGLEWSCIVLLIMAAHYFSSIPASMICMLLIATRQHALLILMHEFSHYQYSRSGKWLNDALGDIFTAFPFFITIHGFRRNHMPHHWHVSTDQDPNWVAAMKRDRYRFPKSRKQIFLETLKHCIGIYTITELKRYTVDAEMATALPFSTRALRLLFATALLVCVTYFHLWWTVLFYWIIPLSTFLMAILYVRDIGEHLGMPSPGLLRSRTVVAGWLERILICQNNVNFHLEHHLFPSVPFFRLKQLHHALLKNSYYLDNAVVTHGYTSGLIREITETGLKKISMTEIKSSSVKP